jgi:hypothetical protein
MMKSLLLFFVLLNSPTTFAQRALLIPATLTTQEKEKPPLTRKAYCRALEVRADEADRFRTDPVNIPKGMEELQKLSSAVFKSIEEEALSRNLPFEEYAKMVAQKSKAAGQEIHLSNYARAQYVNAIYNKLCVMEEHAVISNGRPLTLDPAKLPVFKPFTAVETASKTAK